MAHQEDALVEAWDRLADECMKATRTNLHLISQLSRAGLLPSPTATALTAGADQLEAKAAELRHRHPPDHDSSVRRAGR